MSQYQQQAAVPATMANQTSVSATLAIQTEVSVVVAIPREVPTEPRFTIVKKGNMRTRSKSAGKRATSKASYKPPRSVVTEKLNVEAMRAPNAEGLSGLLAHDDTGVCVGFGKVQVGCTTFHGNNIPRV